MPRFWTRKSSYKVAATEAAALVSTLEAAAFDELLACWRQEHVAILCADASGQVRVDHSRVRRFFWDAWTFAVLICFCVAFFSVTLSRRSLFPRVGLKLRFQASTKEVTAVHNERRVCLCSLWQDASGCCHVAAVWMQDNDQRVPHPLTEVQRARGRGLGRGRGRHGKTGFCDPGNDKM